MNHIYSKNAPEPIGPYSQGVIYGNIVYTSGQIAINPVTGNIDSDTIEGQTEQVMKNLAAVLKEAGAGLDDVIKTTCYLADINDFATFNDIYGKYITAKPARTCVEVSSLPKGALCMVEVIAVKR